MNPTSDITFTQTWLGAIPRSYIYSLSADDRNVIFQDVSTLSGNGEKNKNYQINTEITTWRLVWVSYLSQQNEVSPTLIKAMIANGSVQSREAEAVMMFVVLNKISLLNLHKLSVQLNSGYTSTGTGLPLFPVHKLPATTGHNTVCNHSAFVLDKAFYSVCVCTQHTHIYKGHMQVQNTGQPYSPNEYTFRRKSNHK
jgi:hypothetical protein